MTPSRITFGLLVTGKLEEGGREGGRAQASLADLFRPIRNTGLCDLKVALRFNQWVPEKKEPPLTVRRSPEPKSLPTFKQEIALKVRGWLENGQNRFLIFIDDGERARAATIGEVFADYRSTITALLPEAQHPRVAVHFLVNMIEAYYFADPERASEALGWSIPRIGGDPEEIRNPYSDLIEAAGRLGKDYGKKRETGERVLARIRLEEILKNPEHCGWLRAAVRWLVFSLENATDQPEALEAFGFRQLFHLESGKIAPLTGAQAVLPRPARPASR